MPTDPYHCRVDEAPKETLFGGTYKRTGMIMDQALVQWLWLDDYVPADDHFDPKEDRPLHVHDCDQLVFIVEGRLEMFLEMDGTQSYILEKGDALYIPGKVPHSGKLIDNEPCHLVEIFAPIRTDFLYFTHHQQELGNPVSQQQGFEAARSSDAMKVPLEPRGPR